LILSVLVAAAMDLAARALGIEISSAPRPEKEESRHAADFYGENIVTKR
jgi:hypothetical protein